MNVLHVIASLDPAGGGPPAAVPRLAAAQAAAGATVGILAYDAGAAAARERTAASLAGVPGFAAVRRHVLPPPGRGELLFGARAAGTAGALLPAVDVVHLHGVWEAMLLAVAARAQAAGTPYVIAPRGMLDRWSMAQKALKKRVALALGYRRMLDRAAFLHVLNADERDGLAPLRLTPEAVVIPNGVFREEIEPPPSAGEAHRLFPQLGGRPYVLFLSRLHYKKGLDYLAAAFATVAAAKPEVRLVVAGPDDGERAKFDASVAAAGLSDRVHVIGPVYGPAKMAVLAGAACFCLPSRQEGFSNAITEALAVGVPVVISDACHFPEVAAAGAGVVVPLDPARVAAALLDVLDDPDTRARMGAAGRALVRERYTWPKAAELSLAVYGRAVNRA